jgi:outer membrane protein assembly factor BamA
VLRDVRFVRQNVFPDRHHWLARQANRFNTLTREGALRQAFPIDVGAQIDETIRREAERIMRSKPYLYDALVLVRQVCPDGVDLDVVVRDVWTLTPGIGVSRSGGDNETSVSLSDVNILGTGKSISLEYFNDRDRAGTFVSYEDPNVLGSRWTAKLVAADNDDGERYGLSVQRPFYALDTRHALGFAADHFVREEDLEYLGEDVYELDVETDQANVFFATSSGRRKGWIDRYYFGVRYLDEEIRYPLTFPGPQSTSRRFVYPYIGWQIIEDEYVELTDVNRVGITEDLKLGWSGYAELGWSTDAFGGDGDYLLSRASMLYRKYIRQKHLLTVEGEFRGRYDLDDHGTEDLQLSTEAAYLWEQAEQWRFLTSVRYVHTRDLPDDKQLTLGGDSGLRGYPTRYQPGDRSILLTLEQRYYSNAYPFGLLRAGYAAFVDVGRAWFHDDAPDWMPEREGDHFGTLTNVGIGLRLESIRTRRDRVLHVDIAKPLQDGPGVDSWEITLSGKSSF